MMVSHTTSMRRQEKHNGRKHDGSNVDYSSDSTTQPGGTLMLRLHLQSETVNTCNIFLLFSD
jgi:hypothetical protein